AEWVCDGTSTEVVNGVPDADGRPLAAVGALLTGRGRDAARTLGLPRDPRRAAERLVHGGETRRHLGLLRRGRAPAPTPAEPPSPSSPEARPGAIWVSCAAPSPAPASTAVFSSPRRALASMRWWPRARRPCRGGAPSATSARRQ